MDDQDYQASGAGTVEAQAPPHQPPTPAVRPHAPSRLGVLRYPAYRNVWLGSMVSNVGTWMESVGLQWVVAERTGDMMVMGYLALAQLGPTLALGIIGGLTADRVNRKRMLLVTQTCLMLVAAALTTVSALDIATPRVLIWIALFQGVAMAFNVPAWQVLTPRLVPRAELAKAIALNSMQFNVGRVVGPALAGILISQIGATGLFLINTISFSAVIAAVVVTPDSPAPASVRGRGLNGAIDLTREAFHFVFTKKGPLAVFIGLTLFSILAGPLLRMLPLFVSQVYLAAARTYGVLLAVMGVGAVAGAFLLRFVPAWYPRHHFIPLAILCGGASILALSVVPSLGWAYLCMGFVGLFWIWAFSSSIAAMQLLVPDEMRGRVMSLTNTVVFGAMPLGALAAGLIGEWAAVAVDAPADSGLAVRLGTGILAAVLTLGGLVMLTWRTPEVDGLVPGDAGYDRTPGLVRGITARGHRPRRLRPEDQEARESPMGVV